MFRFYGGQTAGKGTFWTLITLISVIVTFTLLTSVASASDPLSSGEAALCMSCHSIPDMVKVFANDETLSVSLDKSHFEDTVHSFLSCTGCHFDVSMDTHPSADYESKDAFVLHISKSCKMCHPGGQLLAKPQHRNAITMADSPPCSNCHGSHSIQRVSELKKTVSSTQYCLTCHSQSLSLSFIEGDVSLKVDSTTLRGSVHSFLNCSDCHSAFSKEGHPVKAYYSKHQISRVMSRVCRNCHIDSLGAFNESVHGTAMKEHKAAAPACSSCHYPHGVKHALRSITSTGPCIECHEALVGLQEEEAAPHGEAAHAAVHKEVPSNAGLNSILGLQDSALIKAHNKSLPNAGIHFEAVSCTACHVPEAEHTVYLLISNIVSGEVVTDPEITETVTAAFKEQEEPLTGKQLWELYRELRAKGKITFTGKLGLKDTGQAHLISSEAVECVECHNADSESFKDVTLAVITEDGKEEFIPVDPKVMSSLYSLLPLNEFYALGSTKIRLLDYLGLLMVLGGASFPIVHIAIRILTRSIRERR
jgi:hypothetical protein